MSLLLWLLLLGTYGVSECVATDCNGWDSQSCYGRLGSRDRACNYVCECAGPALAALRPYLDVLHPGFLTEQKSGRLLVSSVLKASPAAMAGIHVGDELRKINGEPVLLGTCANQAWDSERSGKSYLTIGRAGRELQFELTLVPIKALLVKNWNQEKIAGYYPASHFASKRISPIVDSYEFGLRWSIGRDWLEVVDVLKGSVAERELIKPGDRIVWLNGKRAVVAQSLLSQPVTNETIELIVLGKNKGSRTVLLTPEGLSKILRRALNPVSAPHLNVAQALR
jgi:C-terminal processing protease CtpA/Prc